MSTKHLFPSSSGSDASRRSKIYVSSGSLFSTTFDMSKNTDTNTKKNTDANADTNTQKNNKNNQFIDPNQIPSKKSPWRQINELELVYDVRLILPLSSESSSSSVVVTASSHQQQQPQGATRRRLDIPTPRFAKVILSLSDILSEDFLNRYVRSSSSSSSGVLLLSSGSPGTDNLYSLRRNGILRLDLCRRDYERSGLLGGVALKNSGGRKHVKQWFRVEVDLKLPSMRKGKKGFDRVLRAAREVLNQSLNWIFVEVGQERRSEQETRQVLGKRGREEDDEVGRGGNVDGRTHPKGQPSGEGSEPVVIDEQNPSTKRTEKDERGKGSAKTDTAEGKREKKKPSMSNQEERDDIVNRHHPTWVDIKPQGTSLHDILVPDMITSILAPSPSRDQCTSDVRDETAATAIPVPSPNPPEPTTESSRIADHESDPPERSQTVTEDDIYSVLEWLDLLNLESPRVVSPNDNPDPYICQYAPPADPSSSSRTSVTTTRWKGLISSEWVARLVVELIRKSRTPALPKQRQWAAIVITAHQTEAVANTDGCTIILQPGSPGLATRSSLNANTQSHQHVGNHEADEMQLDGDGDGDGDGDNDNDDDDGNGNVNHQEPTDLDMSNVNPQTEIKSTTHRTGKGDRQQQREKKNDGNEEGFQRYVCFQFVGSATR